VPMLVG